MQSLIQEPIISYARDLRKNQTEAEKLLWKFLRGRKFHGYKFRRQHPVSKLYILDFYCDEKKLAIELDGMHHHEEDQKQLDDERTNVLRILGITVIRFTNKQVITQTSVVLKRILEALNQLPLLPPQNLNRSTKPNSGGQGMRVEKILAMRKKQPHLLLISILINRFKFNHP